MPQATKEKRIRFLFVRVKFRFDGGHDTVAHALDAARRELHPSGQHIAAAEKSNARVTRSQDDDRASRVCWEGFVKVLDDCPLQDTEHGPGQFYRVATAFNTPIRALGVSEFKLTLIGGNDPAETVSGTVVTSTTLF